MNSLEELHSVFQIIINVLLIIEFPLQRYFQMLFSMLFFTYLNYAYMNIISFVKFTYSYSFSFLFLLGDCLMGRGSSSCNFSGE